MNVTRAAAALLLALAPGLQGWASAADRRAPATPTPPAAAVKPLPGPAFASAAAPAPTETQPAKTGLSEVASGIAEQQSRPASEADFASAVFFDVRSPKAYGAAALTAVAGAATGGLALPAAYALTRSGADTPRPADEPRRGFVSVLTDNVEGHLAFAPAAFAANFAQFVGDGNILVPAVIAGIAAASSFAMEETVAGTRRKVVGGWQASHDQKFRIDPKTGDLKDIRGTHKLYGEDRYEEYAPGHVLAAERLWYRLLAAGFGLYWVGLTPTLSTWIFGTALAALFVAGDYLRLRREKAPPAVRTSEEIAHARRFNG